MIAINYWSIYHQHTTFVLLFVAFWAVAMTSELPCKAILQLKWKAFIRNEKVINHTIECQKYVWCIIFAHKNLDAKQLLLNQQKKPIHHLAV